MIKEYGEDAMSNIKTLKKDFFIKFLIKHFIFLLLSDAFFLYNSG